MNPFTRAVKVQGVVSGRDGGFWVCFGTQSSFVGWPEIYITGTKVVLE